ncbi:MAG: tricarballylate utilization 4Fe-4S protein TcuB [Rhodobacter sp.]|nr:tricarballylate utilization 4Fe-4S protein TcuB [Rhodobacter sp.]
MLHETTQEARRQIEICNACRYCEGYCAVFPAIARARAFADGDIAHLANLCHNCRGCYYACQYTPPHDFAVNLPRVLAEARHQSWADHSWPRGFAPLFDRWGGAIAAVLVLALALIFALAQALRPETGEGFYAHMSHGLMVAIFAPAFVVPLVALAVSLRRYWRAVGGGRPRLADLRAALVSAGRMSNLSGGHGEGCNFEDEDRFSNARRLYHQAVLYGFLLCFAATSSGTVLHYGFDLPAPYPLFSLPKLFGLPGGVLMCIGAAGLAWLKTRADRGLGHPGLWHGEMGFVLLLFAVAATGLALYAATDHPAAGPLLSLHLGTVLTLFLLTPYSKMAHGFYRMAALMREAELQRQVDVSKADLSA